MNVGTAVNANNFMTSYSSPEGKTTGYGYDGLNRRIYKNEDDSIVASYLYDGLEVLQELRGDEGHKVTAYYRANGRIIMQQKYTISPDEQTEYEHRPEGRRRYFTYDALGSVASLSNHTGKQETRYVYDVFGEVLQGDLSDNQYTFTGKQLDVGSSFYHFHFRKYDASVGVWTTPDPIGILGGVNMYSYVQNSPVNYLDFLGLHTGGNNGPGGDPEGNEMPDGFAEGTGEANESERDYYASISGIIFSTQFIEDLKAAWNFLTYPWSKKVRSDLAKVNQRRVKAQVKYIGDVYKERYIGSKIVDYTHPSTILSEGIKSFDNGKGLTNQCHNGKNIF